MKINKYIKSIGLLSITALMSLTSCSEDVDVWDSETLDYSGTYFWELYNEDMSAKYIAYDHNIQLLIYNTAANQENTVWLEDTDHIFPLKSKFSFSGNSESFASTTDVFDELDVNTSALEDASPETAPTGTGETTTVDVDYIKSTILEGKILPDAATTVSGNPVDSIYVKIKLLSGTATFTSYEVDESLRANPEVAEFAWQYQSATYDPTVLEDETYVLSGHRKTGFAEDDH
ncbi:lipid-binding protein [Wenyingzhuangia sp. 1_MG-2023]|nr:lipid-binding protein [Wenyingzhuangia sp. 1_MG-2023]